MSLPCKMIKDLLPLYLDGVCSKESKTTVEDHLEACEACKAELLIMQNSLPINNVERNLKEAEPIKGLSKRFKKEKMKAVFKSVLFTVLAIAVIALILHVFVGIRIT
ncbi:MAG: zf-HC2 domain-containing protein [Oscillospiraceae bacterium]|nr:zf-HC2 domain-containing protein [Oscillospiraceae bacterium]